MFQGWELLWTGHLGLKSWNWVSMKSGRETTSSAGFSIWLGLFAAVRVLGPHYLFLGSRLENEPFQVSCEKFFCNSHAAPQGMWAKEFYEVCPWWEGRVSYLIYKGLFLSIRLVDSEMHINYRLDFHSQDEKCFVLIINTESLLFPFT